MDNFLDSQPFFFFYYLSSLHQKEGFKREGLLTIKNTLYQQC